MAYRPIPFLKKAIIAASLTERFARLVENLGSHLKRNILPARGVVSDSTVLVARKLCFFGPFHF